MGPNLTTEAIKALIVQAPIVGVLILIIVRLYNDLMADRATAQAQREEMIAKLDDLKERVVRLEVATTGDRSPTNSKRPVNFPKIEP